MKPGWLEGPLPSVEEIRRRINILVPAQIDPRGFVRREIGAKTLFVLLYGCAIEGTGAWIRPTAVTHMTDVQAAQQDSEARRAWLALVQGRMRPREVAGRWYGENTRESIRDETLRTMVELGLAVERKGLPTTSPKPRYALALSFAELFNPGVALVELPKLGRKWRDQHLSAASIARLALIRKGADLQGKHVLVTFPSGEARQMAPGPSSLLTRAVIEEFAPRFLESPAVVAVSESARKLTYQDEGVLRAVRLTIDKSRALPDVILVDLGAEPALLVFVECVVSDGPIHERRRKELVSLARAGGFEPGHCAFVTAFRDRTSSPFRALASSLAWGTFAWFETEPDRIMVLRDGKTTAAARLPALLG